MRISNIMEAAGEFKPFTIHGIEFKIKYDEDLTEPPSKQTTIMATKTSNSDKVGDKMFELIRDQEASGIDSKYKSSIKHVHWVIEEDGGLTMLFDCPQSRVEARVAAFSKVVEKELAVKAKPKKKAAAKPIPNMAFPGCRVVVLQSLRNVLTKEIEALGYEIYQQGFTEGSTSWEVQFFIYKDFDIDEFQDKLRAAMQYEGYMLVEFCDLEEK